MPNRLPEVLATCHQQARGSQRPRHEGYVHYEKIPQCDEIDGQRQDQHEHQAETQVFLPRHDHNS